MLKVFFINLDSRPDRRAFMEQQFAELGIDAERIRASIPQTPDVSAVGNMSPAAAACLDSHRRALTMIVERKLPAALVLEDDARLSSGLREFLAETSLVEAWYDVLRLETRLQPIRLPQRADRRLGAIGAFELMCSLAGSAAYIITQEAAKRALRDPILASIPIDNYLFGRRGPMLYHQRIYQLSPALCCPEEYLAGHPDIIRSSIDLPGTRGPKRSRNWCAHMAANLTEFGKITNAFGWAKLLSSQITPAPFAG